MAYVDYQYYTTNYLSGLTPSIESASFLFLEKKAELIIDKKTRGEYLNIEEEIKVRKIKDCICALVENLNKESLSMSQGGGIIQSESVGGHSVSYGAKSSSQFNNEREDILSMYLWNLGILKSRKVYGYEGY